MNNRKINTVKTIKTIKKYTQSIIKSFSGVGTAQDWIRTAIVIIPAFIVSILIQTMLIYIIVMAPTYAIQDQIHKISNVLASVSNWFDKLGNFLTGYGWVDDEGKFHKELERVYVKYKEDGVCIDDTLISATLMYKYFISNDPSAGNDIEVDSGEEENTEETEEINYDKLTKLIEPLAKKQINNDQVSNADYLAYLREGRDASDDERSLMNKTYSSGSSITSDVVSGQKYELTDDQLMGLAMQCQAEQSSAIGAAAEASLMANRFELYGSSYGTGGEGLFNYVKDSGWFYNAENNLTNPSNVNDDVLQAVKGVFVDGNRTFPVYVDEHDCLNCSAPLIHVSSVTNDGVEIDKNNRDAYKKDVSRIQNSGGSTYTFYSFPTEESDPFGYTDNAKKRAEELGLDTSSSDDSNTDETETSDTDNGSSDSEEVTTSSTSIEMEVITLPENLGKVHTYSKWDTIPWDSGTAQLDTIEKLGSTRKTFSGDVSHNDYGIVTYGQWYAGATTSTFGTPGDMLFVIQDDGSVYPVMIADEKSQQVFDNGSYSDYNPANKWGHMDGQCVVEFEVKNGSSADTGGNVPGPNNEFDHYITKVVKVGSIDSTPQYINNVKQALADANMGDVTFIDVGSVTTSGTNANGVTGGSSGGGTRVSTMICPGDLEYYRLSNADIETYNYKDGFLYKYYEDEFKNYNEEQLNYAIENMIREIYYYKNSLTSVMEKQIITSSSSSGSGSGSSSSGQNCSVTGDFQSWLQCDNRWRDIPLGNSSHTICSAGCMVTSVAIQIMKSGTQLLVDDFNPGVFVKTLTQNSGFVGALFANNSASWSSLAPNFKIVETNVQLPSGREAKTKVLKQLIDDGYYVILTVKANQGHWVALDRVEGETVYIMDPASDITKLWDEKYEVENTNTYTTFKADDSAATTITSSGVCAPASGEYKYYNQANTGDTSDGVHYGAYVSKCRGLTLNEIGCSQMSLAIVASGLVSSDITPITVADAYCDVGIDYAVNFSDIVQDSLMEKLGMNATSLFTEGESRETKKQKLQDALNKGYPVVINVTNHFVAVVPGNDGKISLMDPGSKEKTGEYTMEEFDNVVWHGSNNWRIAYYFTKRS